MSYIIRCPACAGLGGLHEKDCRMDASVPDTFDINWHDGAYYVSIPNYKGGTVYSKKYVDGLLVQLARSSEQAAHGWQPIETAPRHCRIRVWSWGAERHAKWNDDQYAKKPRPYWNIESLGIELSRRYQPSWWMSCAEMPMPASVSGSTEVKP